jgi:transposase
MNKHDILFIGLDTHKVFVEVAYIEDQWGAKYVHLGKQSTTNLAMTELAQ